MPTLAKKEYCTGCTACEAVCPKSAIVMKADEYGFLHPEIDTEKCINCSLCEKVCPINHHLNSEAEPKAYAAFIKNETVRLESSSGGLFTEIAKTVLNKGGAVFGAAYNERFEVEHILVENEAELYKLRGAKYAQSRLNNTFSDVKKYLDEGKCVLFSGTPCQVGGLKSFLKKDYDNLITVDFICHSVPSPLAWSEYVKYRAELDNEGMLPENINLRSKETGWSRYQYSNLFKYKKDKSHKVKSGESLYMKLFVGGYICRKSCENCKFKGYSRVSDITLGDFWGIWDIYPEMDDNKGTSAVLVHTNRGQKLWMDINSKIESQEVTLDQISQQNISMLIPSKANPNREYALEKIRNGEIESCKDLFTVTNTPKTSLLIRIKGKIKRLLTGKK